jgi:hypothetical protein
MATNRDAKLSRSIVMKGSAREQVLSGGPASRFCASHKAL